MILNTYSENPKLNMTPNMYYERLLTHDTQYVPLKTSTHQPNRPTYSERLSPLRSLMQLSMEPKSP